MFANNRKKFFGNLGKVQISVENHLRKRQQKHFGVTSWRSIESIAIQHNG